MQTNGPFLNLSNYREALIQPLKVNSPKTKNPQPHVVHTNALEWSTRGILILHVNSCINVHVFRALILLVAMKLGIEGATQVVTNFLSFILFQKNWR